MLAGANLLLQPNSWVTRSIEQVAALWVKKEAVYCVCSQRQCPVRSNILHCLILEMTKYLNGTYCTEFIS